MAIKSKRDSFKENINKNSTRSRIKYVNVHRLKDIKTAKENGNIKFVTSKIHVRNGRYSKSKKPGEVKSNKPGSNRIRTQTLFGNTSSNAKDVFRGDEYNQPDTGIQAVLYASDKIDNVADVIYSSKRVIHAVKGTKKFIDTEIKGKGNIDKRTLIKQLSLKGAKSGLSTARNINTHVSNQFQSEDTDLGIKSFAEAEKEIRKAYDTVSTVKHTASDVSKIITTAKNKEIKGSKYIKDKIYSDKIKRYDSYKERIKNSGRAKSGQKVKADVGSKTSAYRPNRIKTSRTVFNKTVNQRNPAAVSKISKNVIEAAKKAVAFILPGKKTMLLLLIGVAFIFLMLGSSSSGTISALSQQYFMTDDDVAQDYKDKVEALDDKLKKEINELADDNSYDDVEVIYIGDTQGINTNFQEIFAAAAVNFEQDLTYSEEEGKFIEEVYENLYDIKVSSEVYYEAVNEEIVEKTRKIITIYSYNMEDVMSKIRFDDEQKSWARRLVSGFPEQFPEFAQQYGELTQEEIQELIENAPKLSNSKQEKLYDTALSIVGKVKYFWGGKSSAGWNNKWGEPALVTAKGNETTGKYIPFGLDCSGYTDWVYKTAGIGNMLSGGGTAYQWKQSYPIKADELQVGDLAFLQMPNSSGINHVGIYIGKDKDGNNLYAHCEWGTGVTVNGFKGFKYFRRVVNFE